MENEGYYLEKEIGYCQKRLYDSVESLFDNYDIADISAHLGDLVYLAVNPERSAELTKDEIAKMFTEQSNLIQLISKVFVNYNDLFLKKQQTPSE